ncbi:MAG: 2,3-bisphosphoglycerate-independent phosphoglycerate mutase [Thermoleophilaceae bacterium]|nr:2,3-bisphosphoglycerate-independent phosphoglycerate mutase [Thermoleophilaceae bacterium]
MLDQLAREGELARLRTVGPGLPAGSESAIPALLGWTPDAPLDRGAVEAAARGATPGRGQRAWRVDTVEPDGRRSGAGATAEAARQLRRRLPGHRVLPLGGHRLLVCGRGPLGTLPPGLRAWPEGAIPPRVLDEYTTVIAAVGAAAGLGHLLGARVVVPPGATGGPDTDLSAKAAAAARAAGTGAARVVVHVGGADEAAHQRDPAAKVAVLERVDRELLAQLARLVQIYAGTLRVCPDHGCDPHTGEHDGAPVPSLRWTPAVRGDDSGARLTERAVASLPVQDAAAEVSFA